MQIDLTGQVALVVARDGPVAEAVCAALAANGASVLVGDPAADSPQGVVTEALKGTGRLDILVFISPTFGEAGGDPQASDATGAEFRSLVAAGTAPHTADSA